MKVTIFSQIVSLLDRSGFNQLVSEKQTDKHQKGLDSWTQFVAMLFCQFSKSNSLREITNGLRSATGNLNHLGISKAPCRSTLSYQNKHRDWTLFRDYFHLLSEKLASNIHHNKHKFRIKSKIFILDSTTISLCLSVFDWARYRQTKGAIKLHTLLDYDGCLPVFVNMTDGKVHDNEIAKEIDLPKGSVLTMDRAYMDFGNLWRLNKHEVFFVVRLKDSVQYEACGEVSPIKKKTQQQFW